MLNKILMDNVRASLDLAIADQFTFEDYEDLEVVDDLRAFDSTYVDVPTEDLLHAILEWRVERLNKLESALESSACVDYVESKSVADLVRTANNECFRNAVLALHCYNKEARYVEGYVTSPHLPIVVEHGWLEVDGQIVDPTPAYHEDTQHKRKYFPGRRYAMDDIHRRMREARDGEIILPLAGVFGLKDSLHRAAYVAATRATYPKEMADMVLSPLFAAMGYKAK